MIARVFPRKTRATPIDDLSFIGEPYTLFPPEVDEVHISVAFTWDIPEAERLIKEWEIIAPVKIGGPATGMAGNDFKSGKYLKPGYVITSRGCNNSCWFCSVWKREGKIRELPITDGCNILDDNLLACSDNHIKSVFNMLSKQKERIEFTGGLEAALLKEWHIIELRKIRFRQMFFAYDTYDDYEPLVAAGKLLSRYGFTIYTHKARCYVLIGYPKDTFEEAEIRLYETIDAGFMPMAMLYKNDKGMVNDNWRKFQREWARPHIVATKIKKHIGNAA